MDEYHEFYAPFAHIPGRYEWCTIHTTTHGSFDCFIVVHGRTDRPVSVYTNSERGTRFMADRFPESEAIELPRSAFVMEPVTRERADLVLRARLHAADGPVREADMEFRAAGDAVPRAVAYGGSDFAVWGSRWSCEGVDLELDARINGRVVAADATTETFERAPGILTRGSYGVLRPRDATSGGT